MSQHAFPQEYLKLWPYAADQQACFPNVIERFVNWKTVIRSLTEFFQQTSSLEKSIAKVYEILHQNLQQQEMLLGANSSNIFKPWEQHCHQTQISFASIESRTNDFIIARLLALKQNYVKDIEKQQKEILKARTKTAEYLKLHEAQVQNRAVITSQNRDTIDPWLTELLLHHQLRSMIDSENDYQNKMNDIFRDMAVFDSHIITELKAVFEEFNLIKTTQWSSLQNQMQSLNINELYANPNTYFEHFSTVHLLDSTQSWKAERKLEDFPCDLQQIEIVKQGKLYRPSRFGLKMWTPVNCVLTATGYLHCFDLPIHKHNWFDFGSKNEKSNHQRSATCPRPLSPELQPSSATISQQSGFNVEGVGNSVISISLSQPRILIHPVVKKTSLHVFEIIIYQRKSKQVWPFSKSSYNDAVVKYEFKADNDNEMVEWIACLQKQIQNYIPNGPPEPLFKSSQKIEENVEKLVHNNLAKHDTVVDKEMEARKSEPLNIFVPSRKSTQYPPETEHNVWENDNSRSAQTIGEDRSPFPSYSPEGGQDLKTLFNNGFTSEPVDLQQQ
ncbi:hypothetical protein HK103_004725 [Boothiomyces macroporosus]|uniref:PH domain-containing protein n=1 Tax=Boothiomyces macroporosus TaxID=261099 RepID=A0AAD5UM11_9FUNG|nr:hypothetical protein HK103_004725 [Boothiomyces macroporosus]